MPKKQADSEDLKVIVRNRRALHDYEILDRIEAGLVLTGTEVKSLRAGKVNLSDAYAQPRGAAYWLVNLHISPYDKASVDAHDPLRPRKLLLHKRQITKLLIRTQERGLTLIPLQLYFRGPYVKVELGVGRGKRKYDKREAIAKREASRDMARLRAAREGD